MNRAERAEAMRRLESEIAERRNAQPATREEAGANARALRKARAELKRVRFIDLDESEASDYNETMPGGSAASAALPDLDGDGVDLDGTLDDEPGDEDDESSDDESSDSPDGDAPRGFSLFSK